MSVVNKNKQRTLPFFHDLFQGGLKQMTRKIWERVRFRLIPLSRPITTLQRHRALSGKAVIVYTMGKVGSSSVYYTLMKSFPFRKIYHNHFLSNEWLTKRLPGTPFMRNIRLAKPALQCVARGDCTIHYICMMRDPIGRDLSNVVQNYAQNDIEVYNAPIDDLIKRISADGHMFFEDWFNTDFSGHIGQPVTSFFFDPELGYSIHQIDNRKRLLLLKVETIDKVFEKAISEFLGVQVDPQFRFNESSDKSDAAFYADLKKAYRLSYETLEKIYNSDIVKHFYDEAERKALIAKWELK
jgi:hypothetical protein